MFQAGARGQECAVEMDRQQLLPVRERKFIHRMDDLDTSVADQDIDASEGIDRGLYRGVDLFLARDVDRDADGFRPVLAEFRGGCIGRLFVQVRDDDVGALAREHNSDFAADAAGRAGDERDFVLQLHDRLLALIEWVTSQDFIDR